MRIAGEALVWVLTNDDGIDAPGIRALQQAVGNQGALVAPQARLSGCGHQVTTQAPIALQPRSASEYSVAGTPADCVRLAIKALDLEVEWVLSGINAGGNLGVDTYASGTVAAVREAATLGVPGVALSQYVRPQAAIDWMAAQQRAAAVLAELGRRSLPPGGFWNVNLPHPAPGSPEPQLVFCPPSTQPLPVQYRAWGNQYYYTGDYSQRDHAPGTDVDVCFSGDIAVTQLQL